MASEPREFASAERSWEQLSCSETHCVALREGVAYTWPISRAGNRFGQLCRGTAARDVDVEATDASAAPVPFDGRVVAVAAGGRKDGGHTALVGEDGSVWMCGCDRWQQLGLSGAGGAGNAAGYTWRDGRIWQPTAQRVTALAGARVRAVALGADHSLALGENERDVYSWGRGEAGQLGDGKPFVRAPTFARELCAAAPSQRAHAIAALGDCSAVALRPAEVSSADSGPPASASPIFAFAGRCALVRSQLAAALGAAATVR